MASITDNRALITTSQNCDVTVVTETSPPTVSSACKRFGVDIVATDGKRFSGVIDLSEGTDVSNVCGVVCKSRSVTVPLE